MSKINNGGPAFPVECTYIDGEVRGKQTGNYTGFHEGMTLRDYFAIHADMRELIEADGFVPQRIALAVMGTAMPPNWDNDVLAATQWWCDAEARIRYMKADAMIRARGAA